MPWNDQSGGSAATAAASGPGGGQGPWGGGPRRPWGQPPRGRSAGQGPDLEDMLRQWRERFRMGGGGGGGVRSGGGRRGISWRVIAGVLVGGWLLSGVYTVNEGEQAVITRLGSTTAPPAPASTGICRRRSKRARWSTSPASAPTRSAAGPRRATDQRHSRRKPDDHRRPQHRRGPFPHLLQHQRRRDFVFNVRNPDQRRAMSRARCGKSPKARCAK